MSDLVKYKLLSNCKISWLFSPDTSMYCTFVATYSRVARTLVLMNADKDDLCTTTAFRNTLSIGKSPSPNVSKV